MWKLEALPNCWKRKDWNWNLINDLKIPECKISEAQRSLLGSIQWECFMPSRDYIHRYLILLLLLWQDKCAYFFCFLRCPGWDMMIKNFKDEETCYVWDLRVTPSHDAICEWTKESLDYSVVSMSW